MPSIILKQVSFNLSIFHKHTTTTKPYFINHKTNKINILFSSATTTKSSSSSIIILNNNISGARLRMTTPYAPFRRNFTTNKPHRDLQMRAATSSTNGKIDNNMSSNNNDDNNDVVSQPSSHHKLLTLPTILTLGRVAAVPLLVTTFYVESWWGPTATTGIFLAAAITDWLDGYLARRMNLGTQFGAFLDPVADKLMVAATLILLCTKPFDAGMFGQAPWLLTVPAIAIIGREITMSAVREWAASQDKKLLEAVAVNNLGKWKTASQMVALTILLASRDSSFVVAGSLVSSGVVLLYISAWLALWSLVVYMRKIWKVLLR